MLKDNFHPSKLGQRLSATILSALIVGGTIYGAKANAAAEGPASSVGVHELPVLPEMQKTQDSIDKVSRLMDEGEKFFKLKQLDKALIKWQEAYGLSIEMKYTEGEGAALTNMCRFYLERGQMTKAKYMGENSVEVLAGIQDKTLLGRARVQLARAYFGLDNATAAGAQLEDALKLFTTGSTNNAADAAELLYVSADLLSRIGKLQEAIKFYDQAATFYLQANDNLHAVNTRIQIANSLTQLGMFVAANEEASKAVSQARASNNTLILVTALTAQANSQYVLAEYANARKTYEQLLALLPQLDQAKFGAAPRGIIDIGYGTTLLATGDLDQARVVLERAIPIIRKSGAISSQCTAYNSLGIVEELQGQHGKAAQDIQNAIDLQMVNAKKSPKFLVTLFQNIAAVESRSGDNRNARTHLEQALNMLKKVKDPLNEGRLLSAIAEVQLKLADAASAETLVHQAISVSEKIKDDAALWRDYSILARIQFSQEQTAPGKASLTSALSFFRSPQAGVFPNAEQLLFPSTREDLGQKLVAMCAKNGMAEQALLAAEQLKEESFSSEWNRRGGLVRPGDRDVYTDLVTQRAHLHAAETSSTPDKLISEWQSYLSRFRTLTAENRNLARMVAPVPTTVIDIMKAVQARHATIVEYLVGSDSTVVFTLDPSGRISSTVLPVGSKRLQSQVTALLSPPAAGEDTTAAQQRERINLQALYTELLPAAVRNFLPKNPEQMVVVIPDGVLFNLPFAALVDSQGKYMVENHLMTMASSMGVFLDSPPKYADDLSVLITSNASGDEHTITQGLQPDQVTRLGVDPELNTISESARGKAVVHFTNTTPLSTNPMRSMLQMASNGAKRVTADRLFEQTLPSDLILLSATSVNAKDVQGNAVKVFSRGFNYAGARNVMMSLWLEPESSRNNQLVDFYKGKQEGLTQAQSLRKAQLVALSRDPSPKSWAAFQLLGPGF